MQVVKRSASVESAAGPLRSRCQVSGKIFSGEFYRLAPERQLGHPLGR
jgi:hypothetical protein